MSEERKCPVCLIVLPPSEIHFCGGSVPLSNLPRADVTIYYGGDVRGSGGQSAVSEVFVVESGGYDSFAVAVFSTLDLAEAWVYAANAQAVVNAGVPGLSCETREEAAHSYSVEAATLPLDPTHDPLETAEEQFIRHYGSHERYNEWMAGGRYYKDME